MRRRTDFLIYVLLSLIGCLFMSGDLSAQDPALVYVIDIRNEIGSGLSTYISDSIQMAEEARADVIVFDVDTPGGRVDSAVNIIRAIQDTQIPTIAFVNRQAISAGAMISIACNQIVMTSGGRSVIPHLLQFKVMKSVKKRFPTSKERFAPQRSGRIGTLTLPKRWSIKNSSSLNSQMDRLLNCCPKNTLRVQRKVKRWKFSVRKGNFSPYPPNRR